LHPTNLKKYPDDDYETIPVVPDTLTLSRTSITAGRDYFQNQRGN
jgi:hypothetical protein